METIKTYTLDGGGCDLIETSVNNILETLRVELEDAEVEGDDVIEFTIRIEKKYTQKELDDLPEWDGF